MALRRRSQGLHCQLIDHVSDQAMDEADLIRRYFAPLAVGAHGAFDLSDDAAAVMLPPDSDLIITTDALIAGVHFLPDDPPADIAVKALGVNLSDLAGKGADPHAYTLSIALTSPVSPDWLAAFSDGLAAMQTEYGIPLIGGDTTRSPYALMLSITAIGTTPTGRMVRRSGAQPGDLIYVTGTIGDAALGLMVAMDDARAAAWGLNAENREALLTRYRRPRPRTALAEAVRKHAHAALDISDGLVIDAGRMCSASGVSGAIYADRIPLSTAAQACLAADATCRETIFTGGDDYELVLAISPDRADAFVQAAKEAGTPVRCIGEIGEAGVAENTEQLHIIDADGATLSFSRSGYSHFS